MAKLFVVRPPVLLCDGLWTVDCDGYDRGLHVPLRMSVVRLSGGGLLLYSPVPIDDELARVLSQLGAVEHIVAPSRGHYLFASAAKQRYSSATLWVSPGLQRPRYRLPIDEVLREDETPWHSDLMTIHLRGTPAIDEFVFFHHGTQTLICADMVLNITDDPSWLSRQLYRLLGVWRRPGPTRYWRWKTHDRSAATETLDRVLACAPDCIVMAHGEIVHDNATGWLSRALGRGVDRILADSP